MLISENLKNSIWEQIGHEFYNAHLYLFISAFLKNKGFNNLAKHFESQYTEESGHAKIFIDLLTDLNIDVVIPEIDTVSLEFSNITEIASVYLTREIQTTDSIKEIKKLAIEEDNPVVEERMRYMILLQQNEYAEANDFNDSSLLCGTGADSWWKVKVWNDSQG